MRVTSFVVGRSVVCVFFAVLAACASRSPQASESEGATHLTCDDVKGCLAAAREVRARDPGRALWFQERACIASWAEHGSCFDLRRAMLDVRAPRRDAYDWLPVLAEQVERPARVPASARAEDVCAIDPSACPPQRAAASVPESGSPAEQYARRIRALDDGCARGDTPTCVRRAELELMRWTHALSLDAQNIAEPRRFDPRAELTRLCAAGAVEACRDLALACRGGHGWACR